MKKLATLLLMGAVAFMYSCGPSAEEKEKQRLADSARIADSTRLVEEKKQQELDSIAKIAEQKKADSLRQDSIDKAAKGKKGGKKK
ncbi:MAG: hypothetical protein ACM3N9_01505 [Syntrophothermus sp.]